MDLEKLCADLGITYDQLVELFRKVIGDRTINELKLKRKAIESEQAAALAPFTQTLADIDKEIRVREAEQAAAAK